MQTLLSTSVVTIFDPGLQKTSLCFLENKIASIANSYVTTLVTQRIWTDQFQNYMKMIIFHSRGTVQFALLYTYCMDSCWWLINIDIQELHAPFKVFQCNNGSLRSITQENRSELTQEKGRKIMQKLVSVLRLFEWILCYAHKGSGCTCTYQMNSDVIADLYTQNSWHKQVSTLPSCTEKKLTYIIHPSVWDSLILPEINVKILPLNKFQPIWLLQSPSVQWFPRLNSPIDDNGTIHTLWYCSL